MTGDRMWVIENDVIKALSEYKIELENMMNYTMKTKGYEKDDKRLHVHTSNGCYQYWYSTADDSGRKKEIYIPSIQKKTAVLLAQKEYKEKALGDLDELIKRTNSMLNCIERKGCIKRYQSLSQGRRNLIKHYDVSDEEYLSQWLSEKYPRKSFDENSPEYYTDRGERVRSKSEKIIADKLARKGIDYKYECPMRLSNGWIVHPDFTILNIGKRKEIYWEHMGIMDDLNYSEKALYKIKQYGKDGILLGDKLIATFETSFNPLDTRLVDKTIELFLQS